MPCGLIAKLHSWVASNSAAWRSFMMLRASSWVCCAVSTWLETGVIFPSTLNAGGKPVVMNKSEAFLLIMPRSRLCISSVA